MVLIGFERLGGDELPSCGVHLAHRLQLRAQEPPRGASVGVTCTSTGRSVHICFVMIVTAVLRRIVCRCEGVGMVAVTRVSLVQWGCHNGRSAEVGGGRVDWGGV